MGPLAAGNNGVTEMAGKQLGGRGSSRDKGDAEECLEMSDLSIFILVTLRWSRYQYHKVHFNGFQVTLADQCHFCWMVGNSQIGLPSCCWTELDQLMKLG